MITGAYKQNLGETFSTGSHLAGMPRVAISLLKAAFRPGQVQRAMLESGAMIDGLHGVDIRLHGGVLRAMAKVLGVPFRVSQRFAERTAYLAGESVAKAMAEGRGGEIARERGRLLGFAEREIDALMDGTASTQLHNAFVAEFVKQTTAAKTPTEASALADSKKWNAIRAFDRWFMTRTRNTVKVAAAMNDAWKSKDPKRMYAASVNALQFLAGSTLAGMASTYLAMVMKTQSFEEAWEQMRRELGNDGLAWGLTKMGLGASLVGGVGYGVYRAATEPGGTYKAIGDFIAPIQRVTQIVDIVGGNGPYRDMNLSDRLVASTERLAPGMRDVHAIAAAIGLEEQEGPFREAQAAKTKWLIKNGKPPTITGQEPDDPEFATAMRTLRDIVRDQAVTKTPQEIANSDEFQGAMKTALGLGTGKDIARALRARKVMDGYELDERESMRKDIGDRNINVLYTHDQAMDLLAKAFTKKAGTNREVFPAIDEQLEEIERQVNLGGGPQLWRSLKEQLVSDAETVIRAGGRPSNDMRHAARVMARHTDTLEGVFGAAQMRAIRNSSMPRAEELIWRFMIDTAQGRLATHAREATAR